MYRIDPTGFSGELQRGSSIDTALETGYRGEVPEHIITGYEPPATEVEILQARALARIADIPKVDGRAQPGTVLSASEPVDTGSDQLRLNIERASMLKSIVTPGATEEEDRDIDAIVDKGVDSFGNAIKSVLSQPNAGAIINTQNGANTRRNGTVPKRRNVPRSRNRLSSRAKELADREPPKHIRDQYKK